MAWGAEHHILPISVYIKTIVALFLLMALTIGASYIQFPGGSIVNNIVAMVIAIVKATLVVMFFMHVKFSTNLIRIYAVGGFVCFIAMFYILVDYWTRPIDPNIAKTWMHDPGSALMKRPGAATTYQSDPELNINVRPRQ